MVLNENGLRVLWANIVACLDEKVNKETGKGLSSCDFTQDEKDKLTELKEFYHADWNSTDKNSLSYIANLPYVYKMGSVGKIDYNSEIYNFDRNSWIKISDMVVTSANQLYGGEYVDNDGDITLLNPTSVIARNGSFSDELGHVRFFYNTNYDDTPPSPGVYVSSDSNIKKVNIWLKTIDQSAISSDLVKIDQLPCYTELNNKVYWDLNLNGRDILPSALFGTEMSYYHVSNETPPANEMVGRSIVITAGARYNAQSYPIANDLIDTSTEAEFGYYTIQSHYDKIESYFAVVVTDNTYLQSQGYTCKNGIYFMYHHIGDGIKYSIYTHSLELPEVIHKLDPKYLPDELPTDEDMTNAITEATKDFVTNHEMSDAIGNATSGFVTNNDVNQAIQTATSGFMTNDAVSQAIQSATSDFITDAEVNQAIQSATSGFVTDGEVNQSIQAATSNFATHDDVTSAIEAALNNIQNASGVSF